MLKHVREDHGKIQIHLGWMIQEIVDGDASVKATFQKRNENGNGFVEGTPLCLEGLALVGADGVNSAIREHLDMPEAKRTQVLHWRSRLQISPTLGESEASDLLRPYLDIPVVSFRRLCGAVNYTLFNFHEKLHGTMALVVNYHSTDSDFRPGTSPKHCMEENATNDKDLQEIQAILELSEKDGLHHPVRLKVVELPKDNGFGWGGKGRITLTGDAAHGKDTCATRVLCDSRNLLFTHFHDDCLFLSLRLQQ